MKTSYIFIALAVVAALLALVFSFSGPEQVLISSQDSTDPYRLAIPERVKGPDERHKMEQYVAKLQKEKKIVKTFTGMSGEIIDCVDVLSQPALHRSGMEKHVVQFAPRNLPRKPSKAKAEVADLTPKLLYQLTGETCPEKTAPMPRLTLKTLTRFRTLDDFFKKMSSFEKPFGGNGGDDTPPPHEWAHAARNVANWGAEASFNLWSPYVERHDEFSLSQMWVTRGSGASLDTVEAGWQVYEDLYGDNRAHLFIYFTPDNYGSGGCYNLSCDGFVQVSNTIYPGAGFTVYSQTNGAQYSIRLLWYKDGTNGHWWFRYGDTWVGYYPRELFDANGLRNQADTIDFGGEIVNRNSNGRHTRTDMGSGAFPAGGFGVAAYTRTIRYVDTSNTYQQATNLNRAANFSAWYDITLFSSTGSWGQYFYFGGPGYTSSGGGGSQPVRCRTNADCGGNSMCCEPGLPGSYCVTPPQVCK